MSNKTILNSAFCLLLCLILLSSCSISKMRYSRGLNIRLSERFRHSDGDEVRSSASEKRKTAYRFKAVTAHETKDTFPIVNDELQNNKALANTPETDIEHNTPLPVLLSEHSSTEFKSLNRGKLPTQNSNAAYEQSESTSPFSGFSAPASANQMQPASGSKPLSVNDEYYRTMNILGLVSLILCLTFYLSPIAMLMGATALKQFKRNPGVYKGEFLAILGFIFGLIESIILMLYLLFIGAWTGELIWLILTIAVLICIVISIFQV